MNASERARSIVHVLEQYLDAREAALSDSAPLGPMKTAREFLVIAIQLALEDAAKSQNLTRVG